MKILYRLDYWTGNVHYNRMFPTRAAAEKFKREKTSGFRWNISEVKLYV